MKVFFAGIGVYFWPPIYHWAVATWFPDQSFDSNMDRLKKMRGRFWAYVLWSGVVVWETVYLLAASGNLDQLDSGIVLRSTVAWISLSATLGRSGSAIATFKEETLPERIDAGMYRIAQLGAASLMIIAFTL